VQSPLIALALLGFYLLISLIVGVLRFKTVPKEAELLQEDIKRARKGLKARKVSVE
jgi:hypothetical protein